MKNWLNVNGSEICGRSSLWNVVLLPLEHTAVPDTTAPLEFFSAHDDRACSQADPRCRVALATGARADAREQFDRAHSELSAVGMNLYATLARRRLGELAGDVEGARMIAEADAWLIAQGVRAPQRLARLFVPEVA